MGNPLLGRQIFGSFQITGAPVFPRGLVLTEGPATSAFLVVRRPEAVPGE